MSHISAYDYTFKYARTYVYTCPCGAEGGCGEGVVLEAWYMAGLGGEQVEQRLVSMIQSEFPFLSLV